MFLLKTIRPDIIPNRKSDWNRYVRFYKWVLLKLMPIYKHCAISDTMNMGDLQITYNVRDYWYEQELQRFRIDTAQHLEKSSAPFNIKRRFHRACLFCWSESLLIFYNGKSYNIKRDKNFSIATDITGALKISTDKDFILRSEFIIKKTRTHSTNNIVDSIQEEQQPLVETAYKNKPQQKISIRDSVPLAHSSLEPKMKKYQGFEENDIF